jgi:HlyD family secretion protein
MALLLGCESSDPELILVGTVERTLVEVVSAAPEQVVAIEVKRGDRVDAGLVLARLDTTFAEADVANVEAEVAAARTAVLVARHDDARLAELCRRGVSSKQDCERAHLARDEADARLRAAEARLAAARKRLRDHTIVAPVDGIVDQLPFDRGERVAAGAVVAVLLEESPAWVRVWIPQRAIALVESGTAAEVEIDGIDEPLQGRVLDVAREPEFTPHYALTERERTHLVYEARVEIVAPAAAFRPGVPAEVRLRLAAREVAHS